MSLGTTVRQHRESLGLTQGELAKLAGVSTAYISKIELDRAGSISATILLNLATSLHISENILYDAAGIRLKETAPSEEQEKASLIKVLNSLENLSPRGKKFVEQAIELAYETNKKPEE